VLKEGMGGLGGQTSVQSVVRGKGKPADSSKIKSAWPPLPEVFKAGILAKAKAALGGGGSR
jgi:hypothetical protein